MNNVQFRKYSKLPKWAQFEEEVADYLGEDAHRQKQSGAGPISKGDVECADYLVECKFTSKDAYALNVKTWEKIVDEARNVFKTPLFACRSKAGDFIIQAMVDYEEDYMPEEIIEKNKMFNVDRECQLTLNGERIRHDLICLKVDLDI